MSLSAELKLPYEVCALLINRGHSDIAAAKKYLRPRLENLLDASAMLGMMSAVDRLERAVAEKELILIHGDYDVDGMCSTTLLTTVLRWYGANVTPFIPRRLEDGYDLSDAGVRAAIAAGAKLVITCDCGTGARDPVAALKAHGIDVIVTDHHLPSPAGVPDCVAVLNPRQVGCPYPDKDLAGVGVAFKLALQLTRRLGHSERRVHGMLDLVALATIADIAPLRGENRILARNGLRLMRETRNVGLRALLRSSGVVDKPVTAGRVGFVVAPRLNAVGRLGHALRGVELLLSESEHDANAIARELEEMNRRRQDIDRLTLETARTMLADQRLPCGVVLASDEWHSGVVGIVASRVVEETGRPAVLIAVTDGIGKGSARSIPAFDLHAGLGECADLFVRYGGHRSAAGITIKPENIPEFARRFDAVVRSRVADEDFNPEVRIDLELNLLNADLDAIEKLQRHFEPFGHSNPGPVYLARSVVVSRQCRKIGESGLRFCVTAGHGTGRRDLDVITWTMLARQEELVEGCSIDMVFRLERDDWNGHTRLQARLLDFRSS